MDWFEALTGLATDAPEDVRAAIARSGPWLESAANGRRMRAGHLETPSLGALRAKALPDRGRSEVTEIVADVRDLHRDPSNAGAVFQVASQFNLLEMIEPDVTPDDGIRCYAEDPTQGPACAICCGAGTLFRNYFVPFGDGVGQTRARQLDMAEDLHQLLGGDIWDMRNGYALTRVGGLERGAARLREIGSAGAAAALRVGVQRDTEVTVAPTPHLVTQVHASAMPIAYNDDPVPHWDPLAPLVLEAAYEATLRVAALVDSPKVFLTLLGGGAFGNPGGWIFDAIAKACAIVARAGLDIRIVSFGEPQVPGDVLARANGG